MNIKETIEACRLIERAFVSADRNEAERLTDRLTRLVAAHLSSQDTGELAQVAAALGPVVQAADTFGYERPGARWRGLALIASLFRDHPQQIELSRWFSAENLKGQILRAVKAQPGISVSELARTLGKELNHVSNELTRLETAGLVVRVSSGRKKKVFVSEQCDKYLERFDGRKAAQPQLMKKIEIPDREPAAHGMPAPVAIIMHRDAGPDVLLEAKRTREQFAFRNLALNSFENWAEPPRAPVAMETIRKPELAITNLAVVEA